MALVRWEPFRELLSAQDRFNQLFNQTFGQASPETQEDLSNRIWAPAVDIYETEQNLVLKVDLPGVDPHNVEVRVENQTLFIRGERRLEKDVKEGNYHRVERTYGTFARSFSLPNTVNAEGVSAEYKDGVLTLTLAKREEAKPKTIKIQVTGSESRPQAVAAKK